MSFTPVAKTREIPSGAMKALSVEGKEVVVYHVDDAFYATTNTCCHQGGPLGEGLLEGAIVVCPWHAWQFDVATGESLVDPGRRIETYPVRVEQDQIFVDVGGD